MTQLCCSPGQDLSLGHASLGASPWHKHLPKEHPCVPAAPLGWESSTKQTPSPPGAASQADSYLTVLGKMSGQVKDARGECGIGSWTHFEQKNLVWQRRYFSSAAECCLKQGRRLQQPLSSAHRPSTTHTCLQEHY